MKILREYCLGEKMKQQWVFNLLFTTLCAQKFKLNFDFPSYQVFSPGEEGITCFRIPSVVQTLSGRLLAFAEARHGTCGDSAAHEIVQKVSHDGGKTWGPMSTVAGGPHYWVGNPTVVQLRSGKLLMLVALHAHGCVGNCVTGNAVYTSKNEGFIWEGPRDITSMMGGAARGRTGPGRAVQLQSGRILAPVSIGTYGADYVIFSDDEGRHWKPVKDRWFGMDEAQLTVLSDDSVLLVMRHKREKFHGKAVVLSTNGGKTWSPQTYQPELIGPVCQSSVETINGVIYFSGPNSTSGRNDMTVRASHDGGETWDVELRLHTGYSAYSCLVNGALNEAHGCDNCGGVLYEAGLPKEGTVIQFARFPLPSYAVI